MTPQQKVSGGRRVWYSVAMSLDGYIARADGAYDWIPREPEIDWGAFMGRFDTVLMGRKTWEVTRGQAGDSTKMPTFVFSRTLRQAEHPGLTVVADDAAGTVNRLRRESGKEIWLMGGGVPLLPAGGATVQLSLAGRHEYSHSGIVLLTYGVRRPGR